MIDFYHKAGCNTVVQYYTFFFLTKTKGVVTNGIKVIHALR